MSLYTKKTQPHARAYHLHLSKRCFCPMLSRHQSGPGVQQLTDLCLPELRPTRNHGVYPWQNSALRSQFVSRLFMLSITLFHNDYMAVLGSEHMVSVLKSSSTLSILHRRLPLCDVFTPQLPHRTWRLMEHRISSHHLKYKQTDL